jgi:hypothetical protein
MQIFVAGDFDIQPDRGLLVVILPLVQLGADAGEIAFQTASGWVTGTISGVTSSGAVAKVTRLTLLLFPVSSKLSGMGEPL